MTNGLDDDDSSPVVSPSKRLNTPLAAMLPPEYADKDVTEWFPAFKAGEVSYRGLIIDNHLIIVSIYVRCFVYMSFIKAVHKDLTHHIYYRSPDIFTLINIPD